MAEELVVLGSFQHETNTFVRNPRVTTRDDYRVRQEIFGDDAIEALRGAEVATGGAIDVAEERDVDLRPIVVANATPGAPVSEDTYEFYTDTIVEGAREHADDVDGVILPLHGAMVPEHLDDGEGPLIARVREVVGPDVPISVTLDLHGNVTQQMMDESDILVAYKTYPHLDKAETGRLGMNILVDTMRGDVDPVMHFERPPQIIYQPKAYTPSGPMAEMMDLAREFEALDGVLGVSILPGYYHADIPEMGVTTPVVTDGDADLAEEISRELAQTLWARREEFVEEYPGPKDAVAEAKAMAGDLDDDSGPVVMGDFGSNPGGGGASDGTTILRAMIDQGVENAGYAIMHDPETVDACLEAGVGERTTVTLGGKTDDRHGDPIEDLDVYVKAITDGVFTNTGTSHTGTGLVNTMGPTVHIQFGPKDGVSAIVAGTRYSAFDAEVWRHIGIQPERLDVLCIPSFIAFLGDYEPFSGGVVLSDTPGASAVSPDRFEYEKIRKPIFPLDDLEDDYYPE
ncbi:MAG: M81 family metallopeptidase [Natronomonas sp.]|uniref:M81 family metallopeptidase n=1 Tax=Natronomonas sp. TaxID=2184060 RepID=UPI00287076CE|nr:M81 family metallopeptidase [Natronomonas sp.]MDR9431683.1 M81 family metallopeptidase [Natronomonas sp.]